MKSGSSKRALLGALLCLGLLAAPAAAQASTTLTPAGHSFTLATGSTVTFSTLGVSTTCNVSGGTAAVPAAPANKSSGTVTAKFSKGAVTFSGCENENGVPTTVTGTLSSIKFDGTGSTQAYLSGSLTVSYQSLCYFSGPFYAAGTWSNGTLSPHVDSSASLGGEITQGNYCQGIFTWTLIQEANLVFADTTDPAQVITLAK